MYRGEPVLALWLNSLSICPVPLFWLFYLANATGVNDHTLLLRPICYASNYSQKWFLDTNVKKFRRLLPNMCGWTRHQGKIVISLRRIFYFFKKSKWHRTGNTLEQTPLCTFILHKRLNKPSLLFSVIWPWKFRYQSTSSYF